MNRFSSFRFRSALALVLASTLTMTSIGCAGSDVEHETAASESAYSDSPELTAVTDSRGTVTLLDSTGSVLFSQQAEGAGGAVEAVDAYGRPTIQLENETLTILQSTKNDDGSSRIRVARGDGSAFTFDAKTEGADASEIGPRTPVHVVVAVVVVIVLIVSYFSYRGCRSDLLASNALCVQDGGLPGGSCTSSGWTFWSWTMNATCTSKNGGTLGPVKERAQAE